MMVVAGGEVIYPGDLQLTRFFAFGYSFTTSGAMDKRRSQRERAYPNYGYWARSGAFMTGSHGTRGGLTSPSGELHWRVFFWIGSISTATLATKKRMWWLERAYLNCVFQIPVGVFLVRSHGTRGGWTSPSGDPMRWRVFFVLGVAPPPSQLWTNRRNGSIEHAWIG